MTEEEAKAKWCPFARTLDYVSDVVRAGDDPVFIGVTVNREPGGYDAAGNETVRILGRHRCIASACMAWRWSEAKRTAAFLEAVQQHMAGQPRPNFNTAVQAVYAERGGQFERSEGYCGLAGAPQ